MAAPTAESLIEANAAFYRAFEALDMAAMEAVWEASDRLFCVHPGWQALHGREAVLGSWRTILTHTAQIGFDLTAVRAEVWGGLGVVTLYENLQSTVGEEQHAATAISTNLFAFHGDQGGWKLFHHHASLAQAAEPPGVVN